MKIFFNQHMHPDAERHLAEVAEVISDPERIGEVDGILTMSSMISPVTAELMDQAKNLKVIGLHGTGMDAVDLPAAEARGIDCFSAPHLNATAVAELEVGLILALVRRLFVCDRSLQAAVPYKSGMGGALQGHELHGKTFGVIGVGHIGITVGNIMKNGFGMKVIGYDPFFTPERAQELGYGYRATKEEVLQQADVVSLNLPLTDETRLMMGAEQFALMKPTAYFINVSRGFLVDEDALYHALTNGVIAGAAADVRQQEPIQPGDRFLALPNFVLTAHIGANTEENRIKSGFYVVDELVRRLKEKGID